MISTEEIAELRQAVENWEVAEECKREERELVLRTERLQPRLTQDVLNVMWEAADCYGWKGDLHEVYDFCKWCTELINEPTHDGYSQITNRRA